MRLSSELANRRVDAALGRAPQDDLEAAVVLESWGVSPELALEVAGAAPGAGAPLAGPPTVAEVGNRAQDALETAGLLAGVLAATVWAGPVVAALGPAALDAWRVALPLTLTLQWALRRYYPSVSGHERLERLGSLRTPPWALGAVLLAVAVPVLLALCPLAGAAISLSVLWTCGLLLTRRGWAPVYLALLLFCFLSAHLRLPLFPMIGDETETALALAAVAVVSSRPAVHLHGAGADAARSACIGGLLGLMIVGVGLSGSETSLRLVGLALCPSLIASALWFLVVGTFWQVLRPGAELGASSGSLAEIHRASRIINLVGVSGYLTATIVFSVPAVLIAHVTGIATPDCVAVVAELGLVGLAGALLAWLEAVGRAPVAMAVLALAIAAGLFLHAAGVPDVGAYGAIAAAAVTVIACEGVAYRLHAEPEWMAARLL